MIAFREIQSDIESIEKNIALYEEKNFNRRTDAIDYIEFNILDRIERLFPANYPLDEWIALKQYAEKVKHQLEAIDEQLFQRFRTDIRSGVCKGKALKGLMEAYIRHDSQESLPQTQIGYDHLDMFINGLLQALTIPEETREREPEMVYYQQTPARIILELVEKAHFMGQDVFYDLGSGLGQVPILVNLLSGVTAKGIEFEPAYCEYASACAKDLNLPQVEFIQLDARQADFSDGTVFFMYTPFEGRILQAVLEKLCGEAQKRKIRLFTYGPCTPEVSRQNWLRCIEKGNALYKLGAFESL